MQQQQRRIQTIRKMAPPTAAGMIHTSFLERSEELPLSCVVASVLSGAAVLVESVTVVTVVLTVVLVARGAADDGDAF